MDCEVMRVKKDFLDEAATLGFIWEEWGRLVWGLWHFPKAHQKKGNSTPPIASTGNAQPPPLYCRAWCTLRFRGRKEKRRKKRRQKSEGK